MRAIPTLRLLFVVLLMCLAVSRVALASGSITVLWDANPDSTVVGYVVYVGTESGVYSQTHDVGGTQWFVLQNAMPGQRYFFAVSSYAAGPVIGPKSYEVSGYSNAPPLLIPPGHQSHVVGAPVTLQLQGSDPYGEPVSYGATGLPPGVSLTASTGFVHGAATTVGTFPVTAWVTDGVLSAHQSFTWTITASPAPQPPASSGTGGSTSPADTTAPSLLVTSPSAASSFTSSLALLSLAGTAADNVGVTKVSWVNNRGGSGVATGSSAWTIAGIPLQLGANVITVSAYDAAGNAASITVTVTYIDSQAPVVALVSPTTLTNVRTYDAHVVLAGTASDNVGVTRVSWTTDTGVAGMANGTAQWSVGPLAVEPGTTRVLVSAEDAAGNRGSLLVTVNRFAAEPSDVSAASPGGETHDPARPAIAGASIVTLPALDEPAASSGSSTTQPLAPTPGVSMTDIMRSALPRQSSRPQTTSTTAPLTRTARTTQLEPSVASPAPPAPAPVPVIPMAFPATSLSGDVVTAPVRAAMEPSDLAAPRVTITSPTTDGAPYGTADDTVFLVGLAVDDVGVVRVSWTTNRGASGTAEGTSVWSAEVPLAPGENVIAVTARDAAGNVTTAMMAVTRSH